MRSKQLLIDLTIGRGSGITDSQFVSAVSVTV